MEEVTIEKLEEAFPEGAAVFFGAESPVLDLGDFQLRKEGSRVLALAWASPEKDFYFDFTQVRERDGGWWLKTLDGVPCFWSPLSAERAENLAAALKFEEI